MAPQTGTTTPWHSPLSDAIISAGYQKETGEAITPDLLDAFKRGESEFKLQGKTYKTIENKLNKALANATPQQMAEFVGATQGLDFSDADSDDDMYAGLLDCLDCSDN